MRNKKEKIHLEIQTDRKSPVGILRSSYYENGKTLHRQYGRIKGKTLHELKLLRLAFQGRVAEVGSVDVFKILESKEYGASASILRIIKDIGLDQDIYSRPKLWVKNVLAMVIGRIIYQGSKLSLTNEYENTSLWNLLEIDKPDVHKSYQALDELLSHQDAIQKKLAKKHLKDGHLVLYDITSSYLEGEYRDSKLVKYGYNRDGKKGHEQIVIGLLCSKEGCPVGIEVYPGNTKDETTVIDKIKEIKDKYDIKKAIFVGDRGMVTSSNIEKLKDEKDIATISALTRNEIFELLKNNTIQPSLFDEHNIHEVIDPQNPSKRYCLCKNPLSAQDSKNTRERLISLTIKELDKIKNYKRSTKVEILGSRIGKVLQKYQMGKYINWEIRADITDNSKNKNKKEKNFSSPSHQVIYALNPETIKKAELFDGCYIISSNNVSSNIMDANQIVASYKKLELVETAFRNLKTTSIEVRPIYHKTDKRIKAHIFLCMLSYYVQWHMQQRLKPLFDNDGKEKYRRWTFAGVINTLKQITRNKTSSGAIEFYQNSLPTKTQKEIINYLKIKI